MFNIWFFLTLLLDVVPATVVHYIMYRGRLRFSFAKCMVITTSATVLYDLFICYLFFNDIITVQQSVYLRILIFILLLLLKYYLVPGYVLQNTYVVTVVMPYVVIGIILSAIVISHINIENTPPYMVMTLLRAAYTAITIYPIYIMWNKQIMSAINIKDRRIWFLAIGIQFFLNLGVCCSLSADYAVNGIKTDNMVILLILMIATMFTTVFMFYAINVIRTYTRVEEYSYREGMLLQLQEQQYKELSEKIEQSSRLRHDLRHHISLIQGLMDAQKYDEVQKYINDYSSQIPSKPTGVYCENYAINALLNHYVDMANDEKIETEIKCAALADFKGNATDLSIVLGNAFENAIEACRKVEEGRKKFINISAKLMAGQLFITIDNSFDGSYKKDGENFLSSKRDYKAQGFGMSSIASVAGKYGGQIRTDEKDNVFSLSIVMKLS